MSQLALIPRTPGEVDSTDAQCTPRELALALGRFDLDVCSNPRSHIVADRAFMLENGDDGLAEPWTRADGSPATLWCNGPYSYPDPWCKRLRAHEGSWCALWKLETTTEWFRQLMASGASWAPFRMRLRFEKPGNVGGADFCSMLVWKDWTPSADVMSRLWLPQPDVRAAVAASEELDAIGGSFVGRKR